MKVILDTNFLVYCAGRKIDFMQELERLFLKPEIILPNQVLLELRKIAEKGSGKDSKAASLALEILALPQNKERVNLVSSPESNADKAILNLAVRNSVIASFDKELKKSSPPSRFLRIKNKALSILD